MSRPISVVVLILILSTLTSAGDYHVDQKRGSDEDSGSAAAPFKTLKAAIGKAVGGDTIHLQPGRYAGIERTTAPWTNLYTEDFVTIQPADGVEDPTKVISMGRVILGVRAGNLVGERRGGVHEGYLQIKNISLRDGVYVHGYDHVHVDGCVIERIGPWVGSVENIEKFAVDFAAGDDLVVRNSEITRSAGGAAIHGRRNRILHCTIHDITHDGIRCVSSKDSLVEGNTIYNLDDGVEDNDPRGKGWNRHCDAIHIFIPGPGVPGSQNSDLTIRGNVMYNCESQAIQFNNYFRNEDLWNENVTIENNVFGPTRANVVNIAEPVDGIIFRHNTFVYFPEGRSFQGLGRHIECKNHTFRITPACKRAQVYNNILVNTVAPQPGWFVGYNVVLNSTGGVPTRFDQFGVEPQFIKPDAFDGKLQPTSPAINAGTALFALPPIHPTDRLGTQRDARPDCGAYELPNQEPVLERPAPKASGEIRHYVCDLKNGSLDADPWLAGEGQQGLSWEAPTGQASWSVKYPGNQNLISAQGFKGESWMFSGQGDDWADLTVVLDVSNAYNRQGAGLLLRANDATEGYLVDLAAGKITRRMLDQYGKIDSSELDSGLSRLPYHGPAKFGISIEEKGNTTRIDVIDLGTRESVLEAADDTENRPAAGKIGLYNTSKKGHHRTDILAVHVTVKRKGGAKGPRGRPKDKLGSVPISPSGKGNEPFSDR